jgi:hypothetical protein
MQHYFVEYAFFKKLTLQNDDETLLSCCKIMQL